MGSITSHISISLDGFVAGPNQSLENPIGEGGMRLHEWAFRTANWRAQQGLTGGDEGASSDVVHEVVEGVGAYVMGRKMFGGGDGPWDTTWTGWWGEDPPFHTPVYVLTHHARDPQPMQGGTTFLFVTDGIGSALAQARAAAGDKAPAIAPTPTSATAPRVRSESSVCSRKRSCSARTAAIVSATSITRPSGVRTVASPRGSRRSSAPGPGPRRASRLCCTSRYVTPSRTAPARKNNPP